MSNGQINKMFLEVTDKQTRESVLDAIAKHYGITWKEVIEEITHEESEHLLDYLTGEVRAATHVLMRRHKLAA